MTQLRVESVKRQSELWILVNGDKIVGVLRGDGKQGTGTSIQLGEWIVFILHTTFTTLVNWFFIIRQMTLSLFPQRAYGLS